MARSSREGTGGGAQGGGGGSPAQPAQPAGIPENLEWYQLNQFEGLNRKAGPAHIGDQELLWCDNLHPIGPGKLISMPDLGPAFYTAPPGLTIAGQPQGFNLSSTLYLAIVLADGSVQQVLPDAPNTVTQILPPNSFVVANGSDFTQWGSQFLLITAATGNGYWIWDGTSVYTAGTIGPIPQIDSGGQHYSTSPLITTIGGSGTGATFFGTVEQGAVTQIQVLNPGSGWVGTDPTIVPLLFDNGTDTRSAHGTIGIANGVITQATLDSGGHGYLSAQGVPQFPDVVINDAGGTGSGGLIVVTGSSGGILTGLKVVDGGHNYGLTGAVTLSFSGGSGTGAAAHVTLSNGVLNSVVMTDGGAGYDDIPTPVFISPTGSGASATPIMAGDTITGLNFTSGGTGYTAPCFVVFKSGAGPAYATVNLMPFGINGVSIATFQSRVWISHYPGSRQFPPSILFSDINDPGNFGPPGGAFPLTEEYLRYKLTHLIPNGSFLYLIADSSIGYISGVSTSGTPAITTFSITNVDPQTGSPWKDSVYTFGQSTMFANTFGVHQINGGAVRKVSTVIDELYVSAQQFIAGEGIIPSSAVGELNGTHIYALNFPVRDPVGDQRFVVILWDGHRWWTHSPFRANIRSIFTAEIDSALRMYGHDGSSIYQFFQTFDNSLKVLFTKRWTAPSIVSDKKASMIAMLCQPDQTANFTITTVTDNGPVAAVSFGPFPATSEFVWKRNRIDGFGKTIGLNVSSTSPQFTINEILLAVQAYDIRVP